MQNEKVAILIKQVVLASNKISSHILAPHGLTPSQFKIVKFILQNPPQTVRQADIEKHFELRNPTVTGILQNLEKNGWIERIKNPADARSKVICATPKATGLYDELNALGNQIEKELTKNLSSQEHDQLIELLKKILG